MRTIKNYVQLIGNLGRDVEVIAFDSGTKRASVTLATNEYYKNNKGEKVKETHWHNIIAWGKTAELMADNLSKGAEVAIKGKLVQRSYDSDDGSKKYITEVVASEFLRMSKEVPF